MPEPEDNKPNPAPPAPPAAAPAIDPARVEQLFQTSEDLARKVTQLEASAKNPQPKQGTQNWDTVPDRDLQYVITHPIEYPDHATPAFEEFRKRERAAIKAEISSELGASQMREQNQEAFDPANPLGKEVAKILSGNRNQKDILTDVIELAKYRIEGSAGEEKGRKKTVEALRAASAHAPGSEGATITAPPSFMEMPKDQFEKEVERVKMKGFK